MITRQALSIVGLLFLAACGAASANEGAKVAGSKGAAEASGEAQTTKPAPAQATAEAAGAPQKEASSAADVKQPAPGATATPAPAAISLPDLAESPGAVELEAGAEAMRSEEWIKAQKRLQEGIAKLGPEAGADAQLVGRALLGRSFSMGKAEPRAEEAYRKVLELSKDPAVSSRLAGGDDEAQRARQGRAKLAVAEAMYFFAEQKRRDLDKLRMPEYRGANSRDEVSRFVATEVTEFIKKKLVALDDADKAYRAVIDMEGAPPRWVMIAHSRMAIMRGKHMAELRAAPIPAAWKTNGVIPASTMKAPEMRAFYYSALDDLANQHLRGRTVAAYEACKQQSERLGINDEYARTCRVWLEKNSARTEPKQ